MNTATAKQQAFYSGILAKCVALDSNLRSIAEVAMADFASLTVAEASAKIVKAQATLAALQAAAPAPVVAPAKVEVASGHYALVTDGVVKFYEVNNVTEGKWAGYTFVNAQASDDLHKVGREASARILAEIAQNPEAAMKLYGIELGKCGHCGRTLTSDWRKVGIGPVCNKKMGWV